MNRSRRVAARWMAVTLAVASTSMAAVAAPAPATGTDIAVAGITADANPLCNVQATPTLATFGDTVVAGWVDDRMCDPAAPRDGDFSLSAYGWSTDGGSTWTQGGYIRPEPGGRVVGDPVLAVGGDGVFYYASRAAQADGRSIIGVARSDNGGRTFDRVVDASPGRALEGVDQDRPWITVDRSGGPHDGTVHVTWTEFTQRRVGATGLEVDRVVLTSRSTDGGRTFSTPAPLSTEVPLPGLDPASYPGNGTQVATGPGGEVYAMWADFVVPDDPEQYRQWSVALWFTRSLDGGRTFSAPTRFALPTGIGHVGFACVPPEAGKTPVVDDVTRREYSLVLDGEIRVANWPSMAVDTTGSPDPAAPDHNPHHGRIYVAFAHSPSLYSGPGTDPLGDEADVVLLHSETGGQTWEGLDRAGRPGIQVRVNDDATTTDQFHPEVAVDATGTVVLSWYDRRGSAPLNTDIDVYATTSSDGGRTFAPNVRVSDVAFPAPVHHNPFVSVRATQSFLGLPPLVEDPPVAAAATDDTALPPIHGGWGYSCSSLGEHNGLLPVAPGEVLVAWGDNRNARSVSGTDVRAGISDLDVYLDRLRLQP